MKLIAIIIIRLVYGFRFVRAKIDDLFIQELVRFSNDYLVKDGGVEIEGSFNEFLEKNGRMGKLSKLGIFLNKVKWKF